jgi:hypothetical protein
LGVEPSRGEGQSAGSSRRHRYTGKLATARDPRVDQSIDGFEPAITITRLPARQFRGVASFNAVVDPSRKRMVTW